MFERYVSVDWSGSDREDRRVNLRVVEATPPDNDGTVVPPPDARREVRARTRAECGRWLAQALRSDQPRCLIAMDFGFGYPWGSDGSVFGSQGWEGMLRTPSGLYAEEGTARAVAQRVNSSESLGGTGLTSSTTPRPTSASTSTTERPTTALRRWRYRRP